MRISKMKSIALYIIYIVFVASVLFNVLRVCDTRPSGLQTR